VADNLHYSPISGRLATWRARKVVTYIESNLSGTILVAVLARIAGVSCSSFHRTFRSRFGVTPHMYVTAKRVEFAQVLMLTTNESLSQISLACGMTDQAHFTRIFRRLTGKPPGRWRTSRRRQRELPGVANVEAGIAA
jgi:AraC family transcriptional regulator